jgi:hypothetical protein
MTTIKEYVAANATLPPEVVLGNIAWFEVRDGAYDAAALEAGFVKHNLNPHFLPNAINPADAYEKASKGAEGHKYAVVLPDGTMGTAEILVREVARTESQIIRKLIREVRDSANRKLSYDPVGELVFYRPKLVGNRVDHASANVRSTLEQGLTQAEATMLVDLVQKFDADYDRYRRFHDGQKLRGVLREYLLYLNAVLMKASVYFVHNSRSDELKRLKAFAEEFDGLSIELWQIPDLLSHRENVIDAFQREAEKDMAGIIATITKLRSTRKDGVISPAQYLRVKGEYDAVVRRAGEWGRKLEITQTRTEGAAELAAEALANLQGDVYRSLNPEETP